MQPESPVWGYCHDGRVIACAEALVRSESAASIGQVFTDEKYRGHGFAKILVRHISETLIRQGLDVVYIVNEENTPSVRLAQSLGFYVETQLGCLT
jgi:predicted GNAT family acetyltransferase